MYSYFDLSLFYSKNKNCFSSSNHNNVSQMSLYKDHYLKNINKP